MPKILSFLLLPLYTGILATSGFGELSILFAWFAIFNVVLAYGMETTFFRFYSNHYNKSTVVSTSLWSIAGTTLLFFGVGMASTNSMSIATGFEPKYIQYALLILVLDALVIIPFAQLRATEKPMRYAIIKIVNVTINLGLNLFFLLILPKLVINYPKHLFASWYIPNYEITYVFIALLVASAITFLLMLPLYLKSPMVFDLNLWKRMLSYATPILVAGLAYTINEVSDRILLEYLLPNEISKSEIGKYSACYRLALFMTLFATAFRLGIEPFFFNHSKSENPQKAYAQITNYFVIFGSVILLSVVVFADVLKILFVRDESYWEAMNIVPIILLASFCLGVYHNLSVWYKITDRTKFGAYISIVGATLTLLVNVTLIPIMGYTAAAWATLTAYSSMMVLSYYFGLKYYPIPYNMRKIALYGGVSVTFSALSFYVFDRNLIVGSLLLLLFLGLIYKSENKKLKKHTHITQIHRSRT